MRILTLIMITAGLVCLWGCAHPCGYIDIRTVMTPTDGPEQVSVRQPSSPLRIVADVTPENGVLRLTAESVESHSKLFRRETIGKKVYVPYKWYTPIVKPVTAITLIGPFYFSIREPHSHAGYPWRRRDYFRDVISWFNIFSAVPVGPREFEEEDVRVRTEFVYWPYQDVPIPEAGRNVTLRMEGQGPLSAVSGSNGLISFDIAPLLANSADEKDVNLVLSTYVNGKESSLRYTVPADTVRRLKENQKRPAAPGQ